jgi:hypothetical protein
VPADPNGAIVEGAVRELVNGDAVVGVTVAACGVEVASGAGGAFQAQVPAGSCTVRLASADWQATDVTLDLAPGARVELTLWATAAETLVAVYGDTPDRLDADEIAAVPGSLGDPLRALSVAPGLTRTPLDLGWILVRGGAFDHTATFADGVRIPAIRHLGGFASVLHPALVEDVRLDPAPADPRYGEALAGMAEVRIAEPSDDASASIGANVVFAGAEVEVPFADGALRVAGRRSYFDVVLDAVGQDGDAAPRFWDGALRLDQGAVSATVLGVHDALVTPNPDGDTYDVAQDVLVAWLAGQHQGLSVVPSYQWLSRSVDSPTDHEVILEHMAGLRAEWSARAGAFGLDGHVASTALETVDYRTEVLRASAAPYAAAHVGERAGFDMGLRLDNAFVQGQDTRVGLSPSAASRLPVARGLTWRTEMGRSHRTPRTTVILLPENATQPLERSDAATTGFLWEPARVSWSMDAALRRWDYTAGLEVDGSAGTSTGAAGAVETAVDADLGRVRLGFVGSYTRALVAEDPDEILEASLFDQPVRVDALATWRAPARIVASARFRVSSGTPYPYNLGSSEQVVSDVFSGITVPLPGGPRLPTWYALDLQVRREFPFRHGVVDLWIAVQNATNRRVPEPGITGFGEAAPSYAMSLPILPLFGVDMRVVP